MRVLSLQGPGGTGHLSSKAWAPSHPASRYWVAAGCDPRRRAQLGAAVRGRHRNADALLPGTKRGLGQGERWGRALDAAPWCGKGGTEEVREKSPLPGPPPSWVMTHRVLWPGAAMGSSPGPALTSTPCSFIAAFQLEFSRASAPSHLLQQWLNTAQLPRRGTESPSSTTQVTPWEEKRTLGPPATPQKRAPTHTGSP